MSINSAIKAAVEPIVPVCKYQIYDGKQLEYCVYNYSAYPDCFSDNSPSMISYSVQLHYMCPTSGKDGGYYKSIETLKKLSDALFSAGFDYPNVVDASDDVGQHYVIETNYSEERT